MAKLTIDDFEPGDKVLHGTNRSIVMIVTQVHRDRNEVSTRWVDTKGQRQSDTFIPQELEKYNPNDSGIYFGAV